MIAAELRAQIEVEMEGMTVVVNELTSLLHDVSAREPTLREKTAAAAFLAQFYNGFENILKRICYFHGVDVPSGSNWHVELFQQFSMPLRPHLPILLSSEQSAKLAPYRRFRHVALHSYGFQLDWERMQEGIVELSAVFIEIKAALERYLDAVRD